MVHSLVVCDTEPIAIEGVRNLLEPVEDLQIVATESSLSGAMASVRRLMPSLLLIDKAFGIHGLLDCIHSLREFAPATTPVIWATTLSESEAVRLLQAGCGGVVRKTVPLFLLVQCLRTVASGSTWMEQDMSSAWERPARARCELTARELQVRELVERGMKNKDIAAVLGIRTGTVKIHLKHIFEKTGIRGRYGLALSGLKEKGLLTPTALETM
ncbi:MAG: response regulator transcription factor [Acidobacteriia bacterium]|nr:response regulator transcription factor [Terriglobia bacterium]